MREERAPVGALGATRLAWVDRHGEVSVDASRFRVEWWVGAEDRWRVASDESAVRQRRLGVAPAYETAMRIPGGDVVHRVHAIGGPGDVIVIEVENESPAAVALGLVVFGLPGGAELGRARVEVDGHLSLDATKPAAHAVAARDTAGLLAALERGEATGTVPGGGPSGAGVVALLHPLAHRTRARFGVVLDPVAATGIDLVRAPGASDAVRGWEAVLRRGMQVGYADPARKTETDRARADILLAAGLVSAGPELFVALEDWGLDAEAAAVWEQLGWRDRRRAARRDVGPPGIRPRGDFPFGDREPDATTGPPTDAASRLRAARAAVVAERPDGTIVLTPEPPRPGEPLEVHDAPTRSGSLSFAVRWHGRRPALLWDVQRPASSLCLIAPALDAEWTTREPSGETLLDAGPVTAGGA